MHTMSSAPSSAAAVLLRQTISLLLLLTAAVDAGLDTITLKQLLAAKLRHPPKELVTLATFGGPAGGELPKKMVVVEGFDYSVTCTAFLHPNVTSATIEPEMHVHPSSSGLGAADNTSTRQDEPIRGSVDIAKWLKEHGSELSLDRADSSANSSSLKLTVQPVPVSSAKFGFNHRYVCRVVAKLHGSNKTNSSVSSQSEVVSIPKPTLRDFKANMSDCCVRSCPDQDCVVQFAVKSDLLSRLQALGVEVRALFRMKDLMTSGSSVAKIDYNSSTATLSWTSKNELSQMQSDQQAEFINLIAVFFFHLKLEEEARKKVFISEYGHLRDFVGAAACYSDISCFFTTDNDDILVTSLKVEQLLRNQDFSKLERKKLANSQRASVGVSLFMLLSASRSIGIGF